MRNQERVATVSAFPAVGVSVKFTNYPTLRAWRAK